MDNVALSKRPRRGYVRQPGTNDRNRFMPLPKFNPDMTANDVDALLGQARMASELLKALSHETRLLILCILSEGEKSVSELEEIMSMPQAAVSQQLARLRFDRLVHTRREGRMIYYSVADKEVSSVVETLYELFCKPVRKPER
jgi:DNA-binding transcriptional ArsR family regulator